jgi:ethanolamine utilization protein EutP (predicted NTPase)
MRKAISLMVLVALMTVAMLGFGSTAQAEEIKFVGVITKIDIAGKDAKTATATLKDNKTEALIVITVNDDLTLDKFKDHRIVEGDEIRCKYEVVDGKNVAKLFRKTAGC